MDNLHQRAGSRRVLSLHGNMGTVSCLSCGDRQPRGTLQALLASETCVFGRSPIAGYLILPGNG